MKKKVKHTDITGAWVRKKRIEAGLSMQDLANGIGLCPIYGRMHVNKIEKTGAMSEVTRYKIWEFFCCG